MKNESQITILYVDDEPDSLAVLAAGLGGREYRVFTSSNGEEALKLLETISVDLIITDLRMEPMNGFELFQKVKAVQRHAKTPFFFLTAVDDFLAQKYGAKLGVDQYITKPVDLDNLEMLIKNRLQKP